MTEKAHAASLSSSTFSTVVQMASSQETNERAARLVGTMLRDKWHLDALIGVGGMAAVYSATHRNGKRAAIKLLSHDLSDGETTRARFLREGYVANKVAHPGVVNVLDDDTSDDGRAFLVMELLEGETLKTRWMRWKGRMPIEEVLNLAYQLLDVLAVAHDKGIVHRDIKPDNIFLTNDGVLKILDFGVARLRESESAADVTRSTAMLGTPAFMAPEQARSRWEWVDARTDVWAVGATMFTALTGQFVHTATTVTELLITAAMQQARPINSVMPELPDAIAAIIDRALAFEQAQRWPNARAMQSAIGLALQTFAGAYGVTQPWGQHMTNPASTPLPPTPKHTPQSRSAMPSVMEVSRMGAAMPVAHATSASFAAPMITDSLTEPLGVLTAAQAAQAAAQAPTPSIHTALLPMPKVASEPKPQAPEYTQVTTLYRPPPASTPTPPAAVFPQPPPPIQDSPVASTLGAAATASTTLNVTGAKPKTTSLVLAAAGAVLLVGFVGALIFGRSGSESETSKTAEGSPSAVSRTTPTSTTTSTTARIVQTTESVATTVPAPAASASSGESKSTGSPVQTNTPKPRTTPVVTKKRDPFDKY